MSHENSVPPPTASSGRSAALRRPVQPLSGAPPEPRQDYWHPGHGDQDIAGNCLICVDTDGGPAGYGEAGATGPMARARIETMKTLLIGKDPLARGGGGARSELLSRRRGPKPPGRPARRVLSVARRSVVLSSRDAPPQGERG
jgi:L-alanine-DL-glutamate epimerase-like enolase superfamily enzyme